MQRSQRKGHSACTHQTVTPELKLKAGGKTILITTTDQKLSAHAGQATFWGFMHLRKFPSFLARILPHRPSSPNALPAVDIGLGFISGILSGADKLARLAHLRTDPLLPQVMGIKRLASQSTYTRFLAGFDGAAKNLRTFRALWHWGMNRLSSQRGGYTLDLDSTTLLHTDGHQQGVKVGHTPRGNKPCLSPLLAVLAEAKMVVQFWLRPGNVHSATNVINFTLDLLSNLPRHIRVRLIRADSGFYRNDWLSLLETQGLGYIVVAELQIKLQRLIRKETRWQAGKVVGTEVAEVLYEGASGRQRRMILVRHRISEKKRAGGKYLFECPGYRFQALVTNLPASVAPLDVWLDYNGRAGVENVIKELDYGFALSKLCCKKFWATEAALSLAVLTYNLSVLFQRHLGWLDRVNIGTLRFRLFSTAGIISQTQGRPTIKLGVQIQKRDWWRKIWEKILAPIPNCNAVGQSP
jgi:hypothetical protein